MHNNIRVYPINKYDIEGIEDTLSDAEKLFKIKFFENELSDVTTFGELIDKVVKKIEYDHSVHCVKQRIFYKLRNAINYTLSIDKNEITPSTLLVDILPKRNRIEAIKNIEKELGNKLSILRPPNYLSVIVVILLPLSIYGVFLNFAIGTAVLIGVLTLLWLAVCFRNILTSETVGEVVEKITTKYYKHLKHIPKTLSNNGIEKKLSDMFVKHVDFEYDKPIINK